MEDPESHSLCGPTEMGKAGQEIVFSCTFEKGTRRTFSAKVICYELKEESLRSSAVFLNKIFDEKLAHGIPGKSNVVLPEN